MFYTIRHQTRFRYSAPIHENVMEVRVQPRTDDGQQCLTFQLNLRPNARVASFTDHLGNVVHHFNIPGMHNELTIRSEALVKVTAAGPFPTELSMAAWQQLDELPLTQELWEMRTPSHFTEPTPLLASFANELQVARTQDPWRVLLALTAALNRTIAYAPEVTRVDSPIDEALAQRQGVCQDYTHIMLALIRTYLRIPCRYVSGYLYHRQNDRSGADATHAWVEVLLPEFGWVGLDPTNNLLAGERHIRVAVGRDYRDVPPTRGVYKGEATSELSVHVQVRQADDPEPQEEADSFSERGVEVSGAIQALASAQQQQQQQ